MKKFLLIAVCLCSLIFTANSCKKDKITELEKLPPATQTGANTFGCLVNGKAFLPKGYDGTGRPNPHVQYDYLLNGQPYLSIEASKFTDDNLGGGGISITFWDVTQIGHYDVSSKFRFSVGWPIIIGNCGMSIIDSALQAWGGGYISKLDIPNRIISGTFNFKAIKPGCDTVRITDGRFDIKF